MPRLKKDLEAAEQVIGQRHTRQFLETDDAKPSLTPQAVEPVGRPVDKDWADQMKFMEEVIEVTVHTSSEKFAEPVVEVFCNGIPQRFARGNRQAVKRKYVEVLARAKQTNYGNQQIVQENGEETYTYPASTALRYPFTVNNDPNPRGIDWLKSVLAEA